MQNVPIEIRPTLINVCDALNDNATGFHAALNRTQEKEVFLNACKKIAEGQQKGFEVPDFLKTHMDTTKHTSRRIFFTRLALLTFVAKETQNLTWFKATQHQLASEFKQLNPKIVYRAKNINSLQELDNLTTPPNSVGNNSPLKLAFIAIVFASAIKGPFIRNLPESTQINISYGLTLSMLLVMAARIGQFIVQNRLWPFYYENTRREEQEQAQQDATLNRLYFPLDHEIKKPQVEHNAGR